MDTASSELFDFVNGNPETPGDAAKPGPTTRQPKGLGIGKSRTGSRRSGSKLTPVQALISGADISSEAEKLGDEFEDRLNGDDTNASEPDNEETEDSSLSRGVSEDEVIDLNSVPLHMVHDYDRIMRKRRALSNVDEGEAIGNGQDDREHAVDDPALQTYIEQAHLPLGMGR